MAEEINTTPVYAIAAEATSSLGLDIHAHWQAVRTGNIGIQEYRDKDNGAFWAARLTDNQWKEIKNSINTQTELTAFEMLCLFSVQKTLLQLSDKLDMDKTCFILSTTKGNIAQLEDMQDEDTTLHSSAVKVACEAGITAKPIVVSHACISGSVALLYARRLIASGRFEHVIVTGCDQFTPFVLNGFQSFQAIADGPCKPFDANRTGINLGEAAATIILSKYSNEHPSGVLLGGATSNDANHISGPSRTGAELSDAINRALLEANISVGDINMVSAHGTATAYNDEMEAKALNLSGLSDVPVHSLKSYTGHTLGAAGVLESALVLEAIKHRELIPSQGYAEHGVPVPLNVTTQITTADVQYVLKTASGFGGSNAALVWGRG